MIIMHNSEYTHTGSRTDLLLSTVVQKHVFTGLYIINSHLMTKGQRQIQDKFKLIFVVMGLKGKCSVSDQFPLTFSLHTISITLMTFATYICAFHNLSFRHSDDLPKKS